MLRGWEKMMWKLICEAPTAGVQKYLIRSVHNFWQHKPFLCTSFQWIIRKKSDFLQLVYSALPWTGTCVALYLMVYELGKVGGRWLRLKMSEEAWLLWLAHFVRFPSLGHLLSFFFGRKLLENQKASLLILQLEYLPGSLTTKSWESKKHKLKRFILLEYRNLPYLCL